MGSPSLPPSIGVAYGSDSQRVAALIVQAAIEHPQVVQAPAPVVLFEDFADNALLFTVEFWVRLRSGTDGGRVRSELRHRIYALLDQAGIPIPFPQRDVHLEGCGLIEVKVVGSLPVSAPISPPTSDGGR